MMSLLNVTVKKARFVGVQAAQFNTYVTLKLQNVKSTTVTVKGPNPCWEQDFLFETNDINTGLLIEVWSKGMIWDKALGYHWIPLNAVNYANEEGKGQWLSLEADLVMLDGEVVGTKNPTGHSLLVDCRFELPFDPENTEAGELQRKLEMLNNIMSEDQRAEQARRQMQYIGHSGYSEDSDYTSDLNYPVGQHANSSASQYRGHMRGADYTPDSRSLETSRENSYERDDYPSNHGAGYHQLPQIPVHQNRLSPGGYGRHHQRYSPNTTDEYGYNAVTDLQNSTSQYNNQDGVDNEPLFYNSRPKNNFKQRTTRRRKYNWDTDDSQETWYSASFGETGFSQSVDSCDPAALDRTTQLGYAASECDYFGNNSQPPARKARSITGRRPSLERQTTLYDDQYFNSESTGQYYPSIEITDTRNQTFNKSVSYETYYDASSYPYQDLPYGQVEEDRQWDSGGTTTTQVYNFHQDKTQNHQVFQENHINKRRNGVLPQTPVKNDTNTYGKNYDYSAPPTPSRRRQMPQIPQKRSTSRQGSLNEYDTFYECNTPENPSHRGASLPPTPTTTPKLLARIQAHTKPSASLPPTPGRQLPKPNLNRNARKKKTNLLKRTSSAEYNDLEDTQEDYSSWNRPGAMSAQQIYNEDYNYAYQSYDNLQQEDVVTPVISDNRTNITINSVINSNGSNNEYYFNAQESYQDPDDYYEKLISEKPQPLTRKKKLVGRKDNYPLIQQNTDSLESRDDELKDSFDTAISSICSSVPMSYNQNTMVNSVIPNIDLSSTKAPASQANSFQTSNQYFGDQTTQNTTKPVTTEPNKIEALSNTINNATSSIFSFASNLLHGNTNQQTQQNQNQSNLNTQNTTQSNTQPANLIRPNSRILKQQESIDRSDRGYFNHQESIDQNTLYEQEHYNQQPYNQQGYYQDHYLNHQDSIDSYNDETATLTNGMAEEGYKKESPQSVIHVETIEPSPVNHENHHQTSDLNGYHDTYNQQIGHDPYNQTSSLQDPYANQKGLQDPYAQDPYNQTSLQDPYSQNGAINDPYNQRRPSLDPYRPLSPTRRVSQESMQYQDSRKNSLVDNQYNSNRKNSNNLESYQEEILSRRNSVRHSLNQELVKQESIDQGPVSEFGGENEKKRVSFEEEQEHKPVRRDQITAKQRWHWAYNKIVMQLNKSNVQQVCIV